MLHCRESLYETFGRYGILALLPAAVNTALLVDLTPQYGKSVTLS